jgi:hypothetical protein
MRGVPALKVSKISYQREEANSLRFRLFQLLGDSAYNAKKLRRGFRARLILPLVAVRNPKHGRHLYPRPLYLQADISRATDTVRCFP